MYRLVKGIADIVVRRIAQAIPVWKEYTVEKTFPARAPYQPTPPVNQAMISGEIAKHFCSPVSFTAHHLYRLPKVHVTWDGAVFHNLRLFVPSIVNSWFVGRFQDTLLLRQWLGKKIDAPDECVAVCHDQWSVQNYYHWMVDTLPRLLVLRQTYPNIRLMVPQPLPPQQLPDYISRSAAVLGFTQWLPVNIRQIVRARSVILPELTAAALTQNPELVQQVRTELVAALCPVPRPAGRRVYAARAAQGVRCIGNEAEVDALLQDLGFEKVYFEQLSFLEQVDLMQGTAVFLGMHGAGMTNMMFLPKQAQVLELLNEENGDPCYFRLASCLDLPYFCVPCKPTSPEQGNQSDVAVNVGLLQAVVAMAEATAATVRQPTASF